MIHSISYQPYNFQVYSSLRLENRNYHSTLPSTQRFTTGTFAKSWWVHWSIKICNTVADMRLGGWWPMPGRGLTKNKEHTSVRNCWITSRKLQDNMKHCTWLLQPNCNFQYYSTHRCTGAEIQCHFGLTKALVVRMSSHRCRCSDKCLH